MMNTYTIKPFFFKISKVTKKLADIAIAHAHITASPQTLENLSIFMFHIRALFHSQGFIWWIFNENNTLSPFFFNWFHNTYEWELYRLSFLKYLKSDILPFPIFVCVLGTVLLMYVFSWWFSSLLQTPHLLVALSSLQPEEVIQNTALIQSDEQ